MRLALLSAWGRHAYVHTHIGILPMCAHIHIGYTILHRYTLFYTILSPYTITQVTILSP